MGSTIALDVVRNGVIQVGETAGVHVVAASAESNMKTQRVLSDTSISHKIAFHGLAQGDESPWLGMFDIVVGTPGDIQT